MYPIFPRLEGDFLDPLYLKTGTARQQDAWQAIDSLGIFHTLREFQPVLAGTIPLAIDLAESDLDVVCYAEDLDRFDQAICLHYGDLEGFEHGRTLVRSVPTSIASFWYCGFCFECFAQPIPATRQHAYRHLIIEARLLRLAGPSAAREIHRLKQAGWKTEPAFAHYFGMAGIDPYQALLELEACTDAELLELIRNRGGQRND